MANVMDIGKQPNAPRALSPIRNNKKQAGEEHISGDGENETYTTTNATSDDIYTTFSTSKRRIVAIMVCCAGFLSPISAFIFFPAIPYLSSDLHVSVEYINLTVTGFLVVQAIIPSILGDLADQIGRRPTYILALTIYMVASIGLAVQKSYAALFVLRMFQSAGSSGEYMIGWRRQRLIVDSHVDPGNECYGGYITAS
jgi:Na+/melibiose symporter-like transporter